MRNGFIYVFRAIAALSTQSQVQAAAQAAMKEKAPAEKSNRPPPQSKAFCMNMFRGNLVPEQCFPYPDVLSPDQRETLEMLLGPCEKFFQEVNDPAKNDQLELVPDDVMESLKEMGAFGLQVKILSRWLCNQNLYKLCAWN